MVVPIRDLGNITQFPATMSSNFLKSVFEEDIDMVANPIGTMFNLNNNLDEMRSCSLDISTHRPRSPSISSSENKEEYHICVQHESNRMDEDEPINFPDSINLEYMTQSHNHQVSKAADSPFNMRQQCTPTVGPTLNQLHCENVVNIHLNYNLDKALDPES